MTSSDRRAPRQVPPPVGSEGTPAHAYARFIPREELGSFEAWNPSPLGVERRSANGDRRRGVSAPPPPAPPPPDPAVLEAARAAEQAREVQAARHAGYQDGYRDGMAALENFKTAFAARITEQVGQLFDACGAQLDAMQARIADTVADTAVRLARQVVRQELATDPALVVAVARDAVEAIGTEARRLELHLHPDDRSLLLAGAGDLLERRGVTLVADDAIERGGVRLSSTGIDVDATVATRWAAAAALLGRADVAWTAPSGTVGSPVPGAPSSPREPEIPR
jgi:flagellar assembly protein FliH